MTYKATYMNDNGMPVYTDIISGQARMGKIGPALARKCAKSKSKQDSVVYSIELTTIDDTKQRCTFYVKRDV